MKQALEKFYDIIGSISALFDDFIPEALISQGLKPSVATLCTNIEAKYKISTKYVYEGDETRVAEDIEIMAYQIIQELVINVIKHASAKKLTVELQKNACRIFLKITDDGKGFDKSKLTSKTEGGLNKIRARLASSFGWISISSQPEKGTEVSVEINL